MSFSITLRQAPTRLAHRIPQLTTRGLHTSKSPIAARASKTTTTSSAFFTARNAFRNSSRSYMQQAAPIQQQASPLRKLMVGGAIFGGTLVAINLVFNRETRTDGGMPAYEREYLNDTFLHTGLGVGIIALTARQMVQSGFVYRLMVTNPWVVGIGGLALSFGTMYGTRAISPDK